MDEAGRELRLPAQKATEVMEIRTALIKEKDKGKPKTKAPCDPSLHSPCFLLNQPTSHSLAL